MSSDRPKLPIEAVELYNRYIHGEITRRYFLHGVKRFAVGGLTVGAIVDALMPNYAEAQQVSKTDERIKAELRDSPLAAGQRQHQGLPGAPVQRRYARGHPAKLPGILVVHENRGLNPHIEDIARRLALANFMAFAPDALTSVGGYPGDDDKGGQLFANVDQREEDRGLRRCRALAEGASGLHRQDWRHRLLLRRRRREHAGRSVGR